MQIKWVLSKDKTSLEWRTPQMTYRVRQENLHLSAQPVGATLAVSFGTFGNLNEVEDYIWSTLIDYPKLKWSRIDRPGYLPAVEAAWGGHRFVIQQSRMYGGVGDVWILKIGGQSELHCPSLDAAQYHAQAYLNNKLRAILGSLSCHEL